MSFPIVSQWCYHFKAMSQPGFSQRTEKQRTKNKKQNVSTVAIRWCIPKTLGSGTAAALEMGRRPEIDFHQKIFSPPAVAGAIFHQKNRATKTRFHNMLCNKELAGKSNRFSRVLCFKNSCKDQTLRCCCWAAEMRPTKPDFLGAQPLPLLLQNQGSHHHDQRKVVLETLHWRRESSTQENIYSSIRAWVKMGFSKDFYLLSIQTRKRKHQFSCATAITSASESQSAAGVSSLIAAADPRSRCEAVEGSFSGPFFVRAEKSGLNFQLHLKATEKLGRETS